MPTGDAIHQRLEIRKSLLLALASDPRLPDDKSPIHWDRCAALLPEIKKSAESGRPMDESFSVKVQRKLASTVPPRPIVNLKFEDAVTFLQRLCKDGKDVVRVLDYHGSNNLLVRILFTCYCWSTPVNKRNQYQIFLWTFQSRKPQPAVYLRTLLQSVLFGEMKILGRLSIKELIFDDLAETSLPADMILDEKKWEIEVPTDPRFQIAREMDRFIGRAGQSYLDVFRAICQNRSRIRRTLCHTIQDWDELQLDVCPLGNLPHTPPLT